ncbi:E3 ubiquitin-protein ligase RNF114 [Sciurus carolinensis]|uniref:RING-type E3 ubiquitin transferase n=1 Tax=Sciurus carolinensis TaxID=30640 RepID=A0AA41MTX5_SCICA|nr:E3 ubiquitin-protein ligase RNF114 [Sciurus carolinensis]
METGGSRGRPPPLDSPLVKTILRLRSGLMAGSLDHILQTEIPRLKESEWDAKIARERKAASRAADLTGWECLKPKKPVCGVCRSALAPGVRAVELERQIESTETSCHGCRKNFFLSKIRAHVATCSKYQNYIMEGVKATTKDASLQPRNVPNRYTFPCPYCPEKNFDQEGLVEHCKLSHSTDTKSVVCPICASMPWGDPNYRSANFIEHIQRRHQFSYDTFVDYDVDEEDMMNQVLQRSIIDQ